MRTAYVVLGLLMLSAASSYGFEMGIQAGIRDWGETSQGASRPTPQVVVSFGNPIKPNARFRTEIVAGIWSAEYHRAIEDALSPLSVGHGTYRASTNRIGLFGGSRLIVEGKRALANGKRLVHPGIGLGLEEYNYHHSFIAYLNECARH